MGLGTDSVSSNNTCDLLEESRFAILFSRVGAKLATERRMLSAHDALCAATLRGARALGLESHVGELKAGLQADFGVVSLNGTHQLPSYDPTNALVFASSGRDVILTVVAGREVYREGRVTTIDEERLRTRVKEIAAKLGS